MNPKVSLGIAAGILFIAIFYQIYLVISYIPLNQHIGGKWANSFGSFKIDTKNKTLAILDIEDSPLIREYTITAEDKWNITLDVAGRIYEMHFSKDDGLRKTMTLIRDKQDPMVYQLILDGDKDPSIHEIIVDDPDAKLKEINRKRINGEI